MAKKRGRPKKNVNTVQKGRPPGAKQNDNVVVEDGTNDVLEKKARNKKKESKPKDHIHVNSNCRIVPKVGSDGRIRSSYALNTKSSIDPSAGHHLLSKSAADTYNQDCKCPLKKDYGPYEEMFMGLDNDTQVVINTESQNRVSHGMRMRSQINYTKNSLPTGSAMAKDSNGNRQLSLDMTRVNTNHQKFHLDGVAPHSAGQPRADLDLRSSRVPPLIIPKSRLTMQNSDEDEDKTPEYPLPENSMFFWRNAPDGQHYSGQSRNLFSDLCSSIDPTECNTKTGVNCPQRPPEAESRELVKSPSQMKLLSGAMKLPSNLSPKVQRLKLFPKAKPKTESSSANSSPCKDKQGDMSENDILNSGELPGGFPSGRLKDNLDESSSQLSTVSKGLQAPSSPQLSTVNKGFQPPCSPQGYSQPASSPQPHIQPPNLVVGHQKLPCDGTHMEHKIQFSSKGVKNKSKCVKLTETTVGECNKGNRKCQESKNDITGIIDEISDKNDDIPVNKDNTSGNIEESSVEPSQIGAGKGLTSSIERTAIDLHVKILRQVSLSGDQVSGDELSSPRCLVIDEKLNCSQNSSRFDSSTDNQLPNLSPPLCNKAADFLTDLKQAHLRESAEADEIIRNNEERALCESQDSPWLISECGKDITHGAAGNGCPDRDNVDQWTVASKVLSAPTSPTIGSYPSDQPLTVLSGPSTKLNQLTQNPIHKRTPSVVRPKAGARQQSRQLKDASALSEVKGKGKTSNMDTQQQEYVVLVCPVGLKQEDKTSVNPGGFLDKLLSSGDGAENEMLRNLNFVERPAALNGEIVIESTEEPPLDASRANCHGGVDKCSEGKTILGIEGPSSNEDNVEVPRATELCMNGAVSDFPVLEKESPKDICVDGDRVEYFNTEEIFSGGNESESSGEIDSGTAEFENAGEMDGGRNEFTSTLERGGDRVESVCTSEDIFTKDNDVTDEDGRNKVHIGTEQSSPDDEKQDSSHPVPPINQYMPNGGTCSPKRIITDNTPSTNPQNDHDDTFSNESFKKRACTLKEHRTPAKKLKPNGREKNDSVYPGKNDSVYPGKNDSVYPGKNDSVYPGKIQVPTGPTTNCGNLKTAQEHSYKCDSKVLKAVGHHVRESIRKSQDEQLVEKKNLSQPDLDLSLQFASQEHGMLNSRPNKQQLPVANPSGVQTANLSGVQLVNPSGVQHLSKPHKISEEHHNKQSADNAGKPSVPSKVGSEAHRPLCTVTQASPVVSQSIAMNSWPERHAPHLNKDVSSYSTADGINGYSNALFPVSGQPPLLHVNSGPPPLINTRHLSQHYINGPPKPSLQNNESFYEMALQQSASRDCWDQLGVKNGVHQPLESNYTLHSQRPSQHPPTVSDRTSNVNSSVSSQHSLSTRNRNSSLSQWTVPNTNSSMHSARGTYVSLVPGGSQNQLSGHAQGLRHPESWQNYNVIKEANIVNTGAPALQYHSVTSVMNSSCIPPPLTNNLSADRFISCQERNHVPPPLIRKPSTMHYGAEAEPVDHLQGHCNALLAAQRVKSQTEGNFPCWVKVPTETNTNSKMVKLRESATQQGTGQTDLDMEENHPHFNLLLAGNFRLSGKFTSDIPTGQPSGHHETRASQSGGHHETSASQSSGHHETRASQSGDHHATRASQSGDHHETRASQSGGYYETRASQSDGHHETRASQSGGYYETRASQSDGHHETRASQSGGHYGRTANFFLGDRQIISSPQRGRQANKVLFPTQDGMPQPSAGAILSLAGAIPDHDAISREPLDLSLHSKKHPDTCGKQLSTNHQTCPAVHASFDAIKSHTANNNVMDRISSPKDTPIVSVPTCAETISGSGALSYTDQNFIENSAQIVPESKIQSQSRQTAAAKIMENSNKPTQGAHSLQQTVGVDRHLFTSHVRRITYDGQSFDSVDGGSSDLYPPSSGHPICSKHSSVSAPKSSTALMSPGSNLDDASMAFSRASPPFLNTSSSRRTSIDLTNAETSVLKASDVFSSLVKDYYSSGPKENTYSSLLMAQITSKSKRQREENTVTDEIFGFIQSKNLEPRLEVNNYVHKGQVIDLTENEDIVSISSNENSDEDIRGDLMAEHSRTHLMGEDTRTHLMGEDTRTHLMGASSQNNSSLACTPSNDNSNKYFNRAANNFSDLHKQRQSLDGHAHGTHVANSHDGYHRTMIIDGGSPSHVFETPENIFNCNSVVLNKETHYDNQTGGPTKGSSVVMPSLKVNPAGKEIVAEKLRQKLAHHPHQDQANLTPFQTTVRSLQSSPTRAHMGRDMEEAIEPTAQQAAATLLMLSADPFYNNLLMTPEATDNYQEKVYQIHPTLDDNQKALENSSAANKGTRTGRRVGRPPKDDDRSEVHSVVASSVPHSQVPVAGSSSAYNYMPVSCHLNAVMCSPTRYPDGHLTTTHSMNTTNPLFLPTSEAIPDCHTNNSRQKLKRKYVRAVKHQLTPSDDPLLVLKELPNAAGSSQIIHQTGTVNKEDRSERDGPPPLLADTVIKKKRKRRTKLEMLKAAAESGVKPHRKYKTRRVHSSKEITMENQHSVVSNTPSSSSPSQGLSSQNGWNYPVYPRGPSQFQQFFEENYSASNPSNVRSGGGNIDELMHELSSDGHALDDRLIPQTHNEDGLVVLSLRSADGHHIEMEGPTVPTHHFQLRSSAPRPFIHRSSKAFHDGILIQSPADFATKQPTKNHPSIIYPFVDITSESPSRQTVIRANRRSMESETTHSSTNGIDRTEQEVIAWLATQSK
ncbi:unnamed protein product [Lymnaea stagnalis]|uniref:Uncharacterized protein n=1 Tax=Lymnaea stagnalis TaxID=6523 RepID=A0AAV2IFD4_LYMST